MIAIENKNQIAMYNLATYHKNKTDFDNAERRCSIQYKEYKKDYDKALKYYHMIDINELPKDIRLIPVGFINAMGRYSWL